MQVVTTQATMVSTQNLQSGATSSNTNVTSQTTPNVTSQKTSNVLNTSTQVQTMTSLPISTSQPIVSITIRSTYSGQNLNQGPIGIYSSILLNVSTQFAFLTPLVEVMTHSCIVNQCYNKHQYTQTPFPL